MQPGLQHPGLLLLQDSQQEVQVQGQGGSFSPPDIRPDHHHLLISGDPDHPLGPLRLQLRPVQLSPPGSSEDGVRGGPARHDDGPGPGRGLQRSLSRLVRQLWAV